MRPTYEELRLREEWLESIGHRLTIECESCGGRIEKGAAVCPLCHTAVDPED